MWATVENTTSKALFIIYIVTYTLIGKKKPFLLLLSFNYKKTMQISIKQNIITMINIK